MANPDVLEHICRHKHRDMEDIIKLSVAPEPLRTRSFEAMKNAFFERSRFFPAYYVGADFYIDFLDHTVQVSVVNPRLTEKEELIAALLYLRFKTPSHTYWRHARRTVEYIYFRPGPSISETLSDENDKCKVYDFWGIFADTGRSSSFAQGIV